MILSNTEIHRALDEQRLIILPEPKPRRPGVGSLHCPYDTHTVDLRLGDEISIPHSKDGVACIDLHQPGNIAAFITRNSENLKIASGQPYRLDPGKFILGKTLEEIRLPIPDAGDTCLSARIEGKRSRARFGLLVHFTAPTIHPGFSGTLTLEMINLGGWPLMLTPGMTIAQLIVEQVLGLPCANPSQFQGQNTPSGLKS